MGDNGTYGQTGCGEESSPNRKKGIQLSVWALSSVGSSGFILLAFEPMQDNTHGVYGAFPTFEWEPKVCGKNESLSTGT